VHVVGSLDAVAPDEGIFAGRCTGLVRRPLVDRTTGATHHSLVHCELAPGGRIDRHLHAFEEAVYVLSGSLTIAGEELGADDYLWLEHGVGHALANDGGVPAVWLEASAPLPGLAFEDTAFSETAGAAPETPYRRGHFDLADLPDPSAPLGLAGAGANVGGASVRLLVDAASGASQLVLMALRYVPGGAIAEHAHPFEEGFLFLEGELEAELDGRAYMLRPGDFCWSGVGGTHSFANRSDAPVRWLETQAPQPPPRHQFRYRGDWERLAGGRTMT
jgi:quercetin dioxygenase-like cupin family protein